MIQDQPPPIQTMSELPDIADLVMQDMRDRKALGIERYGTPLRPFNGRDALIDAYQEVLDLAVYLRQRIFEDELRDDVHRPE